MLKVTGLCKSYPSREGRRVPSKKAVRDVSFGIERGQTLGLVGESGSGKTTVGRCLIHTTRPDAGEIVFDGLAVAGDDAKSVRTLRRKMQMVFQDPYSSLNPRTTISETIEEVVVFHRVVPTKAVKEETERLLSLVGLPAEMGWRYPHELSGGQRQRVGIARALAVHPSFLICDEPVSALDVSVQAQILNLLSDLQEKLNITCLFIAHDLAVVRHLASVVAVLLRGEIVEQGNRDEVFQRPRHPYTKLLLQSIPGSRQLREQAPRRSADSENACAFYDRCNMAEPRCGKQKPALKSDDERHFVRCFLA